MSRIHRGRTDDIINTGGEKLPLIEVENALRRHPEVIDVACVGVRHARFGEAPAAFVVIAGEARGEPAVAQMPYEHCVTHLERWKRPRLYSVVDAIRRTVPKRTKDLPRPRAILAGIEISDDSPYATLGSLTRKRPSDVVETSTAIVPDA